MPKSRIIIELIDNTVPLEKSLSRLLALAKDVDNDLLYSWVSRELKGYDKENDQLPDYRKWDSVSLIYTGINGQYQVTKNPLPKEWVPEEAYKQLSDVRMYDGISRVIELKESTQPTVFDCTSLAGFVSKMTNGMVSCTSIYAEIPKEFLGQICESVKEKTLLALLELEKQYGCLDDLFIDTSNASKGAIKNKNDEINNKIQLNVILNEPNKKEPWYSKVTWQLIIPIIIAVVSPPLTLLLSNKISKG